MSLYISCVDATKIKNKEHVMVNRITLKDQLVKALLTCKPRPARCIKTGGGRGGAGHSTGGATDAKREAHIQE